MNTRIIPCRSGDEQDYFSKKARRAYVYLSRKGVRRKIKRLHHKRERQFLNADLRLCQRVEP